MNWENAKSLVAQKSGMPLAQNVTLIETAVMAALEEIGIHLTIPEAIRRASPIDISTGDNYVIWNTEYSRLISVTYQYTAGSTYKRVLEKKSPTEYEILNGGMQNQTTDHLQHYCVKSGRIWVGPGNVHTGGSIIVEYQRKLGPEDIDKLPDSNMVVWGGLANILPISNEAQPSYRTMFVNALTPAASAATPTREMHSTIKMNDQILRDDAYRDGL